MPKKKPDQIKLNLEKIITKNMSDVMHESMMPYAEHVILDRALPRVEDGLKPVQRRILFTMLELGMTPDKPHRKSARIVGDCLGKYHPHGDSSVYEAMVRLSQSFNMRVPLVDGHGNFGSIDGDGAAAMRYTEARMTPSAMQLLRDIDKDTVPFMLNFDDTRKEPELLPGRFPNLLVNGATGIAVGLATNIPPHNPEEAINAVIAVMEDPDIPLSDLMKILPAPDFPTGGLLLESPELESAYATGRGKLTVRARTHMEEQRNGRTSIVITEFPYGINKALTLQKVLEVTQEKKALFSAISDIRDESDRSGMRAVIEVKKDGDPQKILQYLFKYTDLQVTFGVNMVAIADGKPQQLSLKQIISYYIAYQKDVVTRRTQFELETARRREHILAGLMIAVNNLDEVIAIIRKSKSPKEAREALMRRFLLTEIQAQAILDLRLQKLTNMELHLIEEEYAEILARIAELEEILSSNQKLLRLIKKELIAIRKELASPRRTELVQGEATIRVEAEDLAVTEDVIVSILPDLKIRRIPVRAAAQQAVQDEIPLFSLATQTNRRLHIFTDHGALLTILCEEIPETKPTSKPVNLASLLHFETGEQIIALTEEESEGDYCFITKGGMVKRTAVTEYNIRAKRTPAISLREGDSVLSIWKTQSESILLVSRSGLSIRFLTDTVPITGRVSSGVHCMKLDPQDSIVAGFPVSDDGTVIVLTDRGYGKRSLALDYEIQGRNGKGVRTIEFRKNGANGTCLVSAFYAEKETPFVVLQRHGARTVLSSNSIRVEPKNGKGSLLIAVVLDDDIVSVFPGSSK